jgi:hypothetical protein
MTPLQELAQAFEAYVMPNRIGDAVSLATIVDSYIRDRIKEARKVGNPAGAR